MLLFLLRRLGHGILVLWLITVATFALFFIAPSNVAQSIAGRQATPETIALVNHRLGLDRPLPEALDRELEELAALFASEDAREGMTAFTDKRPPKFGGR